MTRLNCPTCSAALQLKNAVADTTKVRCPKCANVFLAGDSAVPVVAPISNPDPGEDQYQDEEVSRPARRRFKKKRAKSGSSTALILGLVVGCLVIGGLATLLIVVLVLNREGSAVAQATYPVKLPGQPFTPPVEKGRDNRKPQNPATGPEWKPDPGMLGRLASPRALANERFEIRPPTGYKPLTQTMEMEGQKLSMHRFVGPTRHDGSFNTLGVVHFGADDMPEQARGDLQGFLRAFFEGLKRSEEAQALNIYWRLDPSEKGVVSGMTFLRAYVSGKTEDGLHVAKGFLMVAVDGDDAIAMASLDKADSDSLLLAEAAARTIRRR